MPSPTPRLRGRAAVKQRTRRLQRTNYLCQDCKAKGKIAVAEEVHHVVALKDGGSDEDSNTVNLCKPCHLARGAEQFGHRKRVQIGLDGFPVE